MSERFVDRKDKKHLIKNCPDFKFRRHGVPPIQVVYSFIAALLAVVMLVGHLVIKLFFLPDNMPTPSHEILFILFAIGFCIAAVAVFSTLLIYKIRDTILETEFQNLIFASAARVDTDFCLIINSDKSTIYCDYNFSQLFSLFEDQDKAFERFMAEDGIKKADKDKINNAIKNRKSIKFTVSLKKGDNRDEKYNVTLGPISRPDGYSVLKATLASAAKKK